MKTRKSQGKLILALDVDSLAKAKYFLGLLSSRISLYKVGLQLFTGHGPAIIDLIRKKKAEVFLDLKFYDIPNTVANAVRQAVRLRVKMLTLHIEGGREMLERAVQARDQEAMRLKVKKPLLIGVTVLTSKKTAPAQVLALAKIGIESGLDGVVCSAKETAFLRKKIKRPFVIVTPGIRPDSQSADDQKRVATVSEAVKAGSDFLVIGRPILEAKDPRGATEEYVKNIQQSTQHFDQGRCL